MSEGALQPAQEGTQHPGPSRLPWPGSPPQTIHYTHLPSSKPGSQLAQEWDTYRQEVGRLLADGNEGKFVLLKADQIIGIYEDEDAARAVARKKFLLQPCLIKQVKTWEPVMRLPTRCYQWPNLFSP